MPIYRLAQEPVFPPPELAEPDGLLAIGGDLSPERLMAAYRQGIFPWFEPEGPILWWSPDPRLVLFADEVRITRRLARTIRQARFETRHDTAFAQVIRACAETPRRHESGTWITPEMQRAYIRLHELGHAHCMESWSGGKLVGGVYGIRVGRVFCGESMFHHETDASKVALAAMIEQLRHEGVDLIDCQVASQHLISFGAREISRAAFLRHLKSGLKSASRLAESTSRARS